MMKRAAKKLKPAADVPPRLQTGGSDQDGTAGQRPRSTLRKARVGPSGAPTSNEPPGNAEPAAALSAPTPNILVPSSPRDLLLSYQRAWADDTSRFKIGLMSRQVGKDFSSGEEGVRDCLTVELNGGKTDWLIAAPSERQSLESLTKWKQWAEAYSFSIADYQEEREGGSEALLKSAQITFPGGSRVIAVPGKPETVRGFSANALLTEAAFFENLAETFRAILPSITNPLRGGLKKIRLISTPNGVGDKFHELWTKNHGVPGAKWATHKVTIHDAVAAGLPVDIEELQAALDDPLGWAQEFECDFMDTAAVLLPYDVLAACENPLAMETQPPEFWFGSANLNEPLFCGIDFGRKKDLTVCWTVGLVGGAFKMTREVICLSKLSTTVQFEILKPRVARAVRTCFDATGGGTGLGDLMVEAFGEWKPEEHKTGRVELCNFTNALKLEIFPRLRTAFDQKLVGIPVSRVIREDLHSVHRVALSGGGVTYRAPHTPDGHADRATALALAVRAASFQGGDFAAELI